MNALLVFSGLQYLLNQIYTF